MPSLRARCFGSTQSRLLFVNIILLLAAHIKPSRTILSAALQLSGTMDPFLDHLERDDDVITNGSRTTVYAFILQEVMKPLYAS